MLAILAITATIWALLLFAGLRNRRRVRAAGEAPLPAAPAFHAPLPGPSSIVDLASFCGEIAQSLAGKAALHLVSLRLAIAGPLPVSVDAPALRGALTALVNEAIASSPCGSVMLIAGVHGGRVQVSVIDDGAARARPALQSMLSDIAQVVAMQGGTLDSDIRPDRGMCVVIRLLPANPAPAGLADPAAEVAMASKPRASRQVVA